MAGQTATQEAIGEAQSIFQDRARTKREELVESGQCRAYTIVNFNPISLGLEGELQRYRVPSPDDRRLPADVSRVTLRYDGRDRIGHAITIRDPHIYGRNTGASWHAGGGPGDAIPQREVMYYTPQAVAYNFLEHYSPIFITGADGRAAAPPKDARRVYGVLVFEGDLRTLAHLLAEDEAGNRIEKNPMITVPLALNKATGKINIRTYKAVQCSLDDYLQQMFDGQFHFADVTIKRAQQRFQGTDEDRNDISTSDRIWYRWAINMGYAEAPKPGEKTWLNEMLILRKPEEKLADGADGRRKCQSCRQVEPEEGTPFCPNCNAPINTFQTFMAGHPVTDSWLMALKGEEREIVLKELQIRRQGFGDSDLRPGPGPAPSSPAPSEPAADKTDLPGNRRREHSNKTAANQAMKPASTALPGEED